MCRDAGIEHDIIDGFLASSTCGGRGAASVHNCDSVHGGTGAASPPDCLDSNRGAPGVATGVSGDLAGFDLMDLSGLGAPLNAVTELGAELMTAFSVEEGTLDVAWAP